MEGRCTFCHQPGQETVYPLLVKLEDDEHEANFVNSDQVKENGWVCYFGIVTFDDKLIHTTGYRSCSACLNKVLTFNTPDGQHPPYRDVFAISALTENSPSDISNLMIEEEDVMVVLSDKEMLDMASKKYHINVSAKDGVSNVCLKCNADICKKVLKIVEQQQEDDSEEEDEMDTIFGSLKQEEESDEEEVFQDDAEESDEEDSDDEQDTPVELPAEMAAAFNIVHPSINGN